MFLKVLVGREGGDEVVAPGDGQDGQPVVPEEVGQVDLVVELGHQPGLPELLDLAGRDHEPAAAVHLLQNAVFLKEALPGLVIESHSCG